MNATAWLALAGLAWAHVAPLPAQDVASRVNAVRQGTVRMTYRARPGVCGNAHGTAWMSHRDADDGLTDGASGCLSGVVRLSIERADGQTISVRSTFGAPWPSGAAVTNLGDVSPAGAARYLLELARTLGGRNASDAIAGAALADGVHITPELETLVRDANLPTHVRTSALFWLGQDQNEPTAELVAMYGSLQPLELREQFVFVLSQRRDDRAVEELMRLAQHAPDPEIRKRSMFWLGQSAEPRAIRFLRDILTR